MTIEQFSVKMLQGGKSAQETLGLVKKVFPNSKTSIKCIYYYSSKYGIGLKKSQVVNDEELKKALGSIKVVKAA